MYTSFFKLEKAEKRGVEEKGLFDMLLADTTLSLL